MADDTVLMSNTNCHIPLPSTKYYLLQKAGHTQLTAAVAVLFTTLTCPPAYKQQNRKANGGVDV
jgi:hypothetical protein